MDAMVKLLEELKQKGQSLGHFQGMLNVFIGRKISTKEGTSVCKGLTWRDFAGLLKKIRWNPDAVRELGLNPDDLPPRDRQKYWYSAICQTHVDSPKSKEAGDRFAFVLMNLGFLVDPPVMGILKKD